MLPSLGSCEDLFDHTLGIFNPFLHIVNPQIHSAVIITLVSINGCLLILK